MPQQNFLNQISSIIPNFCDKCGYKHAHSDLDLVSQEGNKAICRLNCSNCGANYLIHVNMPVPGIVAASKTPAFKSEINKEEVKKFANISSIDSDDIIDIHESLQKIKTIDDFDKYLSTDK